MKIGGIDMSKNHLSKEDIKDIVMHLKNYDYEVCKVLKIGTECDDKDKIDNAIETHHSIEYLIEKLNK